MRAGEHTLVAVPVEHQFQHLHARLEAGERLAAGEPVGRFPEGEIFPRVDERFDARRRGPEVELA